MESNNIYVTKKEFYSVTVAIHGYVFLTVLSSYELGWSSELSWFRYILFFFLLATIIFYSRKYLKEKGKCANSVQSEN